MQKYSRQTIIYVLLVVMTAATLILAASNIEQRKNLKNQGEALVTLEHQLTQQKALLKADSLLVEGKYQAAITAYKGNENSAIEDGPIGAGLRVAIAKKFLQLQEGIQAKEYALANMTMNTGDELEEVVPNEENQYIGFPKLCLGKKPKYNCHDLDVNCTKNLSGNT